MSIRKSRFSSEILTYVIFISVPFALFRDHFLGKGMFIGNFDRLNSFLNTLTFYTEGWKTGSFGAWDNSEFMGRNTFALPFTYPNPINWIISHFPTEKLYWGSVFGSCLLMALVGISAFLFLRKLCGSRFAAFVGALLYQVSAFATLKVSQNEMSFAVLIHIPLLLLLLRDSREFNRVRFAALCLIFASLMMFCFLQLVAYVVLLVAAYSLYRSAAQKTLRPLSMFALSFLVAVIAAFPRIYEVAREMLLLQRKFTPDFDMNNFDAVYVRSGLKAYDVFRWFHDGIFGRFAQEVTALKNNLNITEGTLLFMGCMVPFIVIGSLFWWDGRWFGIFRRGNGEARFFAGVIAVSLAVVASKSIYKMIYELFLRMDFSHRRIIVTALLPICCLVSIFLARLLKGYSSRTKLSPKWQSFMFQTGVFISGGIVGIVLHEVSSRMSPFGIISLTDDLRDIRSQIHNPFAPVSDAQLSSHLSPLYGHHLVSLNGSLASEVILYGLTAIFLFSLCIFYDREGTRHLPMQSALGIFLGGLLAFDALRYADFQINSSELRTSIPCAAGKGYIAATKEFMLPSSRALAELRDRLRPDDYRAILTTPTGEVPSNAAAHIGAFWKLRLVDGYNSGVPIRIANLNWPASYLGHRTLTFGSATPESLPWKLLAFLNVKYDLVVTHAFYSNASNNEDGTGFDVGSLRTYENPEPVVPRCFFPNNVREVTSVDEAANALFPNRSTKPAMRVTDTSILETPDAITFGPGGQPAEAIFSGDTIQIDFPNSAEARLLVLNELYHPEWRAYFKNDRLKVLPANIVMRGIIVPPNISEVTMRFEPFGSPRNLLFSSLVATFAGGIVAFFSRRLFEMDGLVKA